LNHRRGQRRIHNYAHPGLRTASAELVNVWWLARVCRALERRDPNLRCSTHKVAAAVAELQKAGRELPRG